MANAPPNADMRLIDVRHLGRERVIGAWLVGDVLVDPGPTSCVTQLLAGLNGACPRALALTHIHLDHAGASGTLVRRWPELEVWVHERGARHLAAPERLVASATRLYGDDMDRLWGDVVAVPSENLRVLAGGETIDGFEVAYTPGHASHHVCYLHHASGRAFVGDAAGVRIAPARHVAAPTPPPDIDLDAWRGSLDALAAWGPSSLAVTHFGAFDDVVEHLRKIRAELARALELARGLDEPRFVGAIASELAESVDANTAAAYIQATPPQQSWRGLNRYLNGGARRA